MTTPESPPRLPTGIFIIRDSADERAISALLARHRVKGTRAPAVGGAQLREELRATERRLHELEATNGQTQELLARAVADVNGERAARQAAEQESENLKLRVFGLEAKLAEPTPIESATSGVRDRDRAAFAALADRLDREALAQPKATSDVLRLAARAVRDEIAAVYAGEKAAS